MNAIFSIKYPLSRFVPLRWLGVASLLWLACAPLSLAADEVGRVVLFSAPFCPYCERFHKEIEPIYAKSPVGRALPLEEVDIQFGDTHQQLARSVRLVPTFVVLDRQGRERARLVGYRSEESFWHDLEQVHQQLTAGR